MKQIIKNIDWKKAIKVLALVAVMTVPVVMPMLVSAQLPGIACQPGQNCTGVRSVNDLIMTVIRWLLGIAFAIAVLFLIIGGFWYITSAGNEETAEKGKNTAINAIIGIVIIVLSYVIVTVVANLVANTGGGNTGP